MNVTESGGREDRESSETYRIGAVAQLTGLSTDTIRAWERRYGLVDPTRTETGLRSYSLRDVQRLRLVKELRDRGESVSVVAGLGLEELQERVATAHEFALELAPSEGPPAVAILDPVLAMQLRERGHEAHEIDVVGTFETLGGLIGSLEGSAGSPAVVVVRLPHLGADPLESLEQILESRGSSGAVVVYNFAPGKLVRKMRALGAQTLQAPVDLGELCRLAREAGGRSRRAAASPSLPAPPPGAESGPPPPRFTEAQLGRLREIESALDCECPQHISAIVIGLLAFERYSAECEDLDPRDAEVHAALHRQTGEARVIMERALKFLCEHENIEL